MTFQQWVSLHQAYVPFNKGGMFMRGLKHINAPQYYKTDYDTNTVPYIVYQEEGFTHWLTKKKVTKNQGFISKKTVGAINQAIQSELLGLPNPSLQQNEDTNADRSSILLAQGGMRV